MNASCDRSFHRRASQLFQVCGLCLAVLGLTMGAGPKGKESARPNLSTVEDLVSTENPPTVDVLKGIQSGQLGVSAEGRGDGKVNLKVVNRTNEKLRVVLPPGLILSGATGQFGGGMGGMGGMGGGMGGMGGGMGGMGGGMGGMGGGMGGMGGGMGGMGGGMGGMGGGMMGGGVMPASMGMMMLGRLIMQLCGDRDSWDQSSLMMGMMGGMGGMGGGMMGGMGGGMGGMGGGMGGMGGGFRSVPPTGPLETTLNPRQSRELPTPIVSMNGPGKDNAVLVPAKGEKLRVSGIEQWTDDSRTKKALNRLAKAKAPRTVAQMVIWYVVDGASWEDVGRLSQGWGNAQELALAKKFVADLDTPDPAEGQFPVEPGVIRWEIKTEGARAKVLADAMRKLWDKNPVLGLTAKEGIEESPGGPALGCRITLSDAKAEVSLLTSHASGTDWNRLARFSVELPKPSADGAIPDAARLGDLVAEGMLNHVLKVQLSKGPRVKGKPSYLIKLVNSSPMILNGLALGGTESRPEDQPSILAGLSVTPLTSLTVPASGELVDRLQLKKGVRVVAANLSGL